MVGERSLIELGRILFEEPLRDEYAGAVSDPEVLRAWTLRVAREIEERIAGYTFRWRELHPAGRKAQFIAALAGNEHTPPDALEALFRALRKVPFKYSCYPLCRLAGNPATPPYVLHEMATLKYPLSVRSWAATNRNITIQTVERLLQSPAGCVREALAANPSVPPDVLAHLATSRRKSVLRAVATNPRTPPEVLVRLVTASFRESPPSYADVEVRRLAIENPSFPQKAIDEILGNRDSLYIAIAVAAVLTSARVPVEKLVELAELASSPASYSSASMPYGICRPKLVELLLSNPKLPEEYVMQFVLDKDENIRKAAIQALEKRNTTRRGGQ